MVFKAQPREQFLDSLLAHRYIGLGEQYHGSKTFVEIRSELLRSILQKDPDTAVLFECSFNLTLIQWLQRSQAEAWGTDAFHQFWNVPSLLETISPLLSGNAVQSPRVFGFDPLEDCRFELVSAFLVAHGWVKNTIPYLEEADSLMNQCIAPVVTKKYLNSIERNRAIECWKIIASEMRRTETDELTRKLLDRLAENRIILIEFLSQKLFSHKIALRDQAMADNIFWLDREVVDSAGHIVLWAANLHLSECAGGKRKQLMGESLKSVWKSDYINVAVLKKFSRSASHIGEDWDWQYYPLKTSRAFAFEIWIRQPEPLNYRSRCE